MSNYSEIMFHIPIFHFEIRNWDTKKKKLLDLFERNKDDFGIVFLDDVTTNFHSLNKNIEKSEEHSNEVTEILHDDIQMFLKAINVESGKVVKSWFEHSVANSSMYHKPHNHGSSGYSSVCFIEYDEQVHSPTQFIAPFYNFFTGETLNYTPHDVKSGSIIFFPSSIIHYTTPNISNKDRIILSFNLQ